MDEDGAFNCEREEEFEDDDDDENDDDSAEEEGIGEAISTNGCERTCAALIGDIKEG